MVGYKPVEGVGIKYYQIPTLESRQFYTDVMFCKLYVILHNLTTREAKFVLCIKLVILVFIKYLSLNIS